MNIDRQNLISGLDGYLNAVALVVDNRRVRKFGALFIECSPKDAAYDVAFKNYYSNHGVDVDVSNAEESEDSIKWLQNKLAGEIASADKKLTQEMTWDIMEMLRMLTEDFEPLKVMLCQTKMNGFSGNSYLISMENGCLTILFLNKVIETLAVP